MKELLEYIERKMILADNYSRENVMKENFTQAKCDLTVAYACRDILNFYKKLEEKDNLKKEYETSQKTVDTVLGKN